VFILWFVFLNVSDDGFMKRPKHVARFGQ